MDEVDRHILNALQGGFPVEERPFRTAAERLGLDEADLIARIDHMLAEGRLSRFGPLYSAERLGGGLTLAAMAVPEDRFDAVAAAVNDFPEVAHNYRRTHALNMWFVIATERPEQVAETIARIQAETGLPVYDMPKIEEYFLELRLDL